MSTLNVPRSSTVKSSLTQLFLVFASATVAISAPIGICLHAFSPDAPADKIECFEFSKVEQIKDGYRFFLEPNGSTVVTKYRYRGHVPYKANLLPGQPDFDRLLKLYEETARATPSTRRFLNSRITDMRYLGAEKSADQQFRANLPKIEISGNTFLAPGFKGIENGKLVIMHKDGVAKLELKTITDDQLQALVKLDSEAAKIVVVDISKSRLWNPEFNSLSSTSVKIKHEEGILEVGFDDLSEKDKEIIMSWSDGTWKIGKPGFYRPKSEGNSYSELILEEGKFYDDVELLDRSGESIIIRTRKENLKLPFGKLSKIPGIAAQDSERLEAWAAEILDERLDGKTPEISTEVLSFREAGVLRVTDVRVKILQVLDEGVLASTFIGNLHKGTRSVKTTKAVSAEHQVTGRIVTRVIDTSVDEFEVTEAVTDDLCYIVGNTSNLTDGEIVKADSMRLLGRHQYIDVSGRPRTVRKYHVD